MRQKTISQERRPHSLMQPSQKLPSGKKVVWIHLAKLIMENGGHKQETGVVLALCMRASLKFLS